MAFCALVPAAERRGRLSARCLLCSGLLRLSFECHHTTLATPSRHGGRLVAMGFVFILPRKTWKNQVRSNGGKQSCHLGGLCGVGQVVRAGRAPGVCLGLRVCVQGSGCVSRAPDESASHVVCSGARGNRVSATQSGTRTLECESTTFRGVRWEDRVCF